MSLEKKLFTLSEFHPLFVNFPSDLYDLALRGLQLMEASHDPMHTIDHVIELLDLYAELRDEILAIYPLTAEEEYSLLLAFIWHDVYKATQLHPNNVFYFLYDQAIEGKLSANIFLKTTGNMNLPLQILHTTVHAIKYHATFAFMPWWVTPNVAQVADIILDLDTLENMNSQRIRRASDKIERFFLLDNSIAFHTMNMYVKHLGKKRYRLPISPSLAKLRAEEFLDTLSDLRNIRKSRTRY